MDEVNRRPVLMAAYAVAALLVLVPSIEVAAGSWPFQPHELSWRFGVGGIVLKTVVTPLLGMLIAMVAAAALDHRRTLRVLAVVALAASVLTLAVAALFVLDFLQLRTMVNPQMRNGMTVASGTALVMAGLVVPAAAALGIGGLKATRRAGPARASRKARSGGILVTPQLKENAT